MAKKKNAAVAAEKEIEEVLEKEEEAVEEAQEAVAEAEKKVEEEAAEAAEEPKEEAKEAVKTALPADEEETDDRPLASAKSIIITVIAGLVALLAIAFVVLHYVFGWTYVSYKTENGEKITFLGKVDSDDQPVRGRFRYPGGVTGYVNSETGEIEYTNGMVYKGTFVDLQKEGTGTLTITKDGGVDTYVGEFSHDEINGKGTYTYANGDVYEGEFKNGKKDGSGKYTWANGAVYEGEFKEDKKEGEGVFTYVNGAVYDGEWRDDLKNGEGTYTWADGARYTGTYVNDVREGTGKMEWADGSWYEGEFKDNKMNGKGFYSDYQGRTYEGTFEDGAPIRTTENDAEETAAETEAA